MEINEVKLKKILKEQREEYQIHITALAEDFQSKLATGLEPLVSMSTKIERLGDVTAKLAESMLRIEARISALEKTVSVIAEMVAQNTEDISEIKHNLKQKTGIDEFHTLEKRVLRLERRIA